jgi:dTDP-4-amino-4,6-dideoxygalactose transaminase
LKAYSTIQQLAILGGTPVFPEKLHVGRPNIGNRDHLLERINELLDRRWLTNNGPFVQEFERKIAEYIGVKHCITVCNATVALEIAIRALGLKGEVILPSFTFVATAHALQWQEITPIFGDINPATHNLDPASVERLITPRTTGIIGVHVWGRPCEVESLSEIAQRHNIKLMFDAAHAFGCSHDGLMLGNFGEVEVFSFHATKFLNSFEGGAIVTNNDELARKIRNMINFGFAGYDNVAYLGINGKMTEICAAMGLTSLEDISSIIEVNRQNYQEYQCGLAEIPGITIAKYNDQEKSNYQYVILEIDEQETGISRDTLIKILHAENILARRYFYPGCHEMEPYRSYFPNAGLLLPQTQMLTKRVMSLPNGTAISDAEVQTICDILKFVVANASEITKALE